MSLFDIVGPIMIGPSSSHTAGAVRLGLMGRLVLGEKLLQARLYLHGSFKDTYTGHGTDKALIAGLLGFNTDDTRIRQSLVIAHDAGLTFEFMPADLGDVHPNTVKMELIGETGRKAIMIGCSVGGGAIIITEVNGYSVQLTGQYPVLIIPHLDKPGLVAQVTAVLAAASINIAKMQVSRQAKGSMALMVIESDQIVDEKIVDMLNRIQGIKRCFALYSP
jgi:L-serine dehydratase